MSLTHNFEISVDGITVSGEIGFNHGEEAEFKTTTTDEMTIKQHKKIQNFFEFLVRFHKECAEITKIEIIEKET
jgi:hypothetical protein